MRIGVIGAVGAAIAAGTAVAAILFLYAPSNILQPSTANLSAPGASNGTNASVSHTRPALISPTAGYPKVNVTVSNYTLVADIADTPQRMQTGLDVRDSMNESQAMLFPFTSEGHQGFWMKGMKIPIDIIWIDKDQKVVHIEASLPPCTPLSCPVYTPSEPAMYVLETTAGFAQRHNVTAGTSVNFDLSHEIK